MISLYSTSLLASGATRRSKKDVRERASKEKKLFFSLFLRSSFFTSYFFVSFSFWIITAIADVAPATTAAATTATHVKSLYQKIAKIDGNKKKKKMMTPEKKKGEREKYVYLLQYISPPWCWWSSLPHQTKPLLYYDHYNKRNKCTAYFFHSSVELSVFSHSASFYSLAYYYSCKVRVVVVNKADRETTRNNNI